MIHAIKPKALESGDVISIVGAFFPFAVPPEECARYINDSLLNPGQSLSCMKVVRRLLPW
jgi:hypothetical protein